MNARPRRSVPSLKLTHAIGLVVLTLLSVVGLPVLTASSADAGASPGRTMSEDVGVILISPPTTTTTTVTTKVSTPTPATTTNTTQHPVILVTSPNTAKASPTIVAFTGAPIASELMLAAALIAAGCVLLVAIRIHRRRRTHTV